jgi:hypothetical protein
MNGGNPIFLLLLSVLLCFMNPKVTNSLPITVRLDSSVPQLGNILGCELMIMGDNTFGRLGSFRMNNLQYCQLMI